MKLADHFQPIVMQSVNIQTPVRTMNDQRIQAKKKILIIDDEIDLCLLLKNYFTRKDCEVNVSHTLGEGLDMLKKESPDVLFLDNNLPDGVAWDMAPTIAKNHPNLYIVLISAYHQSVPTMPLNAHFNAITKPISLADLNSKFALM
jgi:DNA-binding NtrC family response regulator